MTPEERQYRRVLRLLPAGYRRLWGEDMVSAYMDCVADSPRRSVGEWLSVAWLALRIWLNGSHATPSAQFWYQLVLGVAMLTTLYESLTASVLAAGIAFWYFEFGVDPGWQNHVAHWWGALSMVWLATFVCLVLGRPVAARVLVLVALAHDAGLTALIVKYTINPSSWGSSGTLPENNNQAWLWLAAVTVILVPNNFRPSRGWLAAYAVPAAAIVPITLITVTGKLGLPQWLQLLQLLNVGTLLHLGMIVGMVVALVRAPRWRLPLAVFGGAVAAAQLLGHDYGIDFLYELRQQGIPLWTWVNVVQLILAGACAVAGLVAVRRARATGGELP